MRGHVTKITLAATLAAALIGVVPASARHGQYSLVLATGHGHPWPTAKRRSQPEQSHQRAWQGGRGYQWDPWGHWGSYYGPMIGIR
jgi:hypothetical protein